MKIQSRSISEICNNDQLIKVISFIIYQIANCQCVAPLYLYGSGSKLNVNLLKNKTNKCSTHTWIYMNNTSDALSFTSHSWVKKWNSVIIPSGFIMMTYSKNYPVFSFGSSLLSFLFFAFKPRKTHWELIIQNVHTKSKIPLIMWIISYYGDLCQNHICYVGTCIRYPKLIEAGFFFNHWFCWRKVLCIWAV